jgi:REP element-mobilizing transposase RayT
VQLRDFVVMPNHLHGIIGILEKENSVGTIHESSLPRIIQRRKMLLPMVIGRFKMNTAKRINIVRGTEGNPVWQRDYFEHIIRDERSLQRITDYITTNPQRWSNDKNNPAVTRIKLTVDGFLG